MSKIFHAGNHTLNWLFNGFFFVTLYFAVTSPNIILGDNKKTGAGTTAFTVTWLLIAAAIVIGLLTYTKFRAWVYQVFVVQKLRTAILMAVVVVLWQIVFVAAVHPPIGFDVGAIHDALTNTTSSEMVAYFSLNYNNIPILLAQHYLAALFGTTSWLFFDYVTLVLVDLSAVLNVLGIFILDRKRVPAAIYIHALWLLVFPMIIVSYTDTWVLPLVSGYFLCYCVLSQPRFKPWGRALAAIGFGVFAASTYFMKPSAIVGVIAIVLVEGLFWFKRRSEGQPKTSIGLVLLAVVAIGGTYVSTSQAIAHQSYITSYTARQIPAIHFISMGVSGEGGYNPKDALKMSEIPTKAGRTAYSKKMLIKRLKKMGALGYVQFLIKKQRNNTADGTFAWAKEGHFINENPTPTPGGFAGTLREFVYLYGTHLGDFRFMAQVWWIIWLVLIGFGWRDQRKFVQVLRMTIIGGFIYLLIFEGGRSRYLIQFLPAFLMLAALVYDQTLAYFKRVYRWANGLNKSDKDEIEESVSKVE